MIALQKAPATWTFNDLLWSLLVLANARLQTAPAGISAEDLLWSLLLGGSGGSGVPTGGALGEVLTWGASGPEWGAGTPGPPGGAVAVWPAPFVSSDGTALDDPRGAVGDLILDGDFLYTKVDDSPDTWLSIAIGTVVPA